VRDVLEELSKGTAIDDAVIVSIMEANNYDVATCVDALLEIINVAEGGQASSTAQEERELEEELAFYQKCKEDADRAAQAEREREAKAEKERQHAAASFLSEELKRKEEAEAQVRALEAAEKARFAAMRQDLESEWQQRLDEQKKELLAKQEALVKERKAILSSHMQRDAEFKEKLEEALKRQQPAAPVGLVKASDAPSPKTTTADNNASSSSSSAIEVELTCPAEAEMNSKITVFWEYKSGKPSLSDWIGYYKKSRPEKSNQYYTYAKTGGSEKGKLEFTVPAKLGICEVRMFQNNDYNMVARSSPIRVGNSVTLEVDDSRLASDGTLAVACSYKSKQQHSGWDWVGVFEEQQKDNRLYVCSAYVAKDKLSLPLRKPGRYVVRYFQSGSGYSDLAESAVFEVPDRDWIRINTSQELIRRNQMVEVEWNIQSIDPSSKDRVGLFRAGEFNPLMPLSIQNTHCNKASGTLKFQLSQGLAPGSFQFVFMANGSSRPVKKSPSFVINE